MKSLRLIRALTVAMVMVVFLGSGVHAEYHHVDDCSVCHYAGGTESSACMSCPNNLMIKCEIDVPDGDPTDTTFGPYVTCEYPYNGICEVCHTLTDYHTNTDDGTTHFDGSNCMPCHPHTTQPDLFYPIAVVGLESHETHISENRGPGVSDCTVCHLDTENYSLFADGEPLETTSACDTCHSPGGAFNGAGNLDGQNPDTVAFGAKYNWGDGIYESGGTTLKFGKGQWCGSCHDGDPANSKADGSGVNAPGVIGDNSTYGFYTTGHGAHGRVECLDCHVASKAHIDHNHRTYEVDEAADPDVVVNPYCDSYRLEDDAMYLPRDYRLGGISRKAFALCFDCHNYHEILGENMNLMDYGIQWDYSHTNFWDASSSYTEIGNAHYYHLRRSDYTQIDSDWDGARDSRASCISCHNVHGPPNRAMIRHGELISKPGTTDKVPALNFAYLDDPTEPPATATWETPDPLNGTYEVYAHWQAWDNRAPDATYTVHYDEGGPATDPVTVDQTANGGVWNLLGTYFYSGSNGKVVLDNIFTHTIPLKQVVGADAIQWVGLTTVIVDDTSATYLDDYSSWNYQTGTFEALNGDWHYIHPHMTTPNAATTLANSKGGIMDYSGFYVSDTNLCLGCHTGTDTRYDREPKLWPKVITMPGAEPDVVYVGSGDSPTITVTVVDPDDNVSTVTIDLTPIGGSSTQAMTDNGDDTYSYTVNGLDTYPDQPITFEITATDLDANTGTGLVTIFIYEPGGIYIDDRSAVFTLGWYYKMVHPEQYLICFRYTEAEIGGTRTCTWTPNVPQAGNYEVSAWWIDNPAQWRCVDVPYTINYNGGSETVRVDQTDDGPGGGKWNYLGTWNFAQGTSGTVVIGNDATPTGVPGETSYVTADAVKLVPVP